MTSLALVGVFTALAVATRLFIHVPNFTAVGALALFSGFYLPRRVGFSVPIVVMLVTDAFVGFYDWRLMAVVYGSFAVTAVMGWWLKRTRRPATVAASAFLSAGLFFVLTNAAVWLFSAWYPHTLGGLISAYIMGLPFFAPTLAGNLLYSGVFFGAHELVARRMPLLAKAKI